MLSPVGLVEWDIGGTEGDLLGLGNVVASVVASVHHQRLAFAHPFQLLLSAAPF